MWTPLKRWGDFRRRQVAALEQSNRIAAAHLEATDGVTESEGVTQNDGATRAPAAGPATGEGAGSVPVGTPPLYGTLGKPLNRHSPFYLGFFGATGALLAIGLWGLVGRLTTTLTILVVAFFLTLTLGPIVDLLVTRGMRRGLAVLTVFLGLLVVFGLIGALVIPPVVLQGSQLASQTPGYVQDVLNSRWLNRIDQNYDVLDKVRSEAMSRLSDQQFIEGVLGGILGAGRLLISGVFQFFTVLVLTLYFLSSLPRIKQAAYAAVPATRRPRVISLSEEIMRRVGSYAIGQVMIASLNAALSYVLMSILGIPYAAVLAVTVGLLGLIPMIGATLGAAGVVLVAFFHDPRSAVIAITYYVIYQQLENYVVAPRVMQRTVSVPGPVTVVAALAGGALLGVLGALLAIPVAAGLILLYEEVLVPRQRAH
ncbi:MAG: AI-2E family transporter [Ornithinibacter sp.]